MLELPELCFDSCLHLLEEEEEVRRSEAMEWRVDGEKTGERKDRKHLKFRDRPSSI